MIIKYVGHACFKILDEETGYSIVFDPYEPGSVKGFRDIRDAASEVLCTHGHFDHNYKDAIMIEPKDESPYEVQWIDTFHDPQKGALRGPNRIYVVTHKATGEKLVHYGDIGEVLDDLLTEENLELLKDADIALVPVGGVYTYDRQEALDLIERTAPKLVLPMHYRSESAGFGLPNIDSIENFIKDAAGRGHGISVGQVWFINTAEYDIDADILVLRPQNMKY
ncbi:MAG: MBL fold metallo-hydrolase [Mogibacterium sp.]|nr:MBL fold metallo-hydrolase [Mogibacterium sp.]